MLQWCIAAYAYFSTFRNAVHTGLFKLTTASISSISTSQRNSSISVQLTHYSVLSFINSFLQVLRHAFTYHWKLWTLPEILELLHEAGFPEVHVWIRCMIVSPWAIFYACCLAHPACHSEKVLSSCSSDL